MSKGRIESLDGLRAIAASLIVVYHLGLANFAGSLAAHGHASAGAFLASLGSSGVELFFTLSAVVLLRPYLRAGRPMNVRAFASRRVTRLWPPFFAAWLLAGCIVALLAAAPTWWPSAMPGFDLRTWFSQAFIIYAGKAAYNFAWWTLTIEAAFYVLAPLCVVVLRGRSAGQTWALFASMVAISLVAGVFAPAGGNSITVARFLSFASCFAGGLVLARQDVGTAARAALAGAGAVVIVVAALWPAVNPHVGYGLLYLGLVSWAITSAAWLRREWLLWLGERSYSLFLTHYSVIALACWSTSWFIASKSSAYFLVSRSLALVGSVAAACLLFELVESRFAHGLTTVGQWRPGARRGEQALPVAAQQCGAAAEG